ncbi:hypothetical protein EYF80_023541 [Liparis tanakae]|uniref:Uncharacterized protein n=1 Tax=Liparis tanakae TaxID=230148 RepID=A0A4Z2HN42_9TELE|nr:hypothetical protein EYF80_023541 [Liparis tanakae]
MPSSDRTSHPQCQGAAALGEKPGARALGSGEKRDRTCNLRNLLHSRKLIWPAASIMLSSHPPLLLNLPWRFSPSCSPPLCSSSYPRPEDEHTQTVIPDIEAAGWGSPLL